MPHPFDPLLAARVRRWLVPAAAALLLAGCATPHRPLVHLARPAPHPAASPSVVRAATPPAAVETPPAAAATPPEPGAAVPLMGFRPLRSQTRPGA